MNKEEYIEYTIPGGRYGTDDLKSIYAFHGGSQGDESRSNDVNRYKRSDGWLVVSSWFKDIDYLDQEKVDKLSKELDNDNELYIQKLKKSGKFGKKLPDIKLSLKPFPPYDDPNYGNNKPTSEKPIESYRMTFLGDDVVNNKNMNKTEVYKTKSDPIIDKLQKGFKIDAKALREEIPEEVWVLEIENNKGIVYLFGEPKNYKDEEDFANKAREYVKKLLNTK